MQSPSILLVYGTRYGHTQKIIERMAEVIRRHGGHATTAPGNEVPEGFDPTIYDGAIVAASVIGGRHQRYVQRFIAKELRWLQSVPSAFFSICGSAASPRLEEREAAHRLADTFVASLGWKPSVVETIGGEIAYTRYWWGLRFVMRNIAKRQGASTDTSRDIDLTNWADVDRMAADFLKHVEEATGAAAATTSA